ncbi:carbonic anhydrase [Tessaracoccus sp. OH4464_COT-324]|uniref:beta-class carbonic anhydrase n=1 Tax=Tessaracoccus sp. OH4464_COT-324 TaxID=2491059 RepID=UPI000F644C82|nr:carbonic anhydrase [Tessaracoccus sp. OH4464_COT-324]RRD47409.1 carbonic anhydrase [Tessaracoccus sp. OH4464_COT-324]
MSFDDLLAANRRYAESFPHGGFDGIARKGVLMITCMDSRIDPLDVIGLGHGDAKILRSPGGQVSETMLRGAILGVHLLGVQRIMVMPHTKCAMASGTDADLRDLIAEHSGLDTTWINFGASPDQLARLHGDVSRIANHPLLKDRVEVGGFMYDVDTGLLEQLI